MNRIEWPILSHSDPIQFSQVPPLEAACQAAEHPLLESPEVHRPRFSFIHCDRLKGRPDIDDQRASQGTATTKLVYKT